MKDILISWALLLIAGAFLLYLGFSFAQWDLNPGRWPEECRGGLAVLVFAWGVILALLGLHKLEPINEE